MKVHLGYKQVITPHIGNKDLYITSGHYQKYGAGQSLEHLPHSVHEYAFINCTQFKSKTSRAIINP